MGGRYQYPGIIVHRYLTSNYHMEKLTFQELGIAPELLQAIETLGYEQPSPIQAQAIPPGIEGRDVVGQSQTGSGKTMAFAIPALQRLDKTKRGVQVLILCPTRELAMQVCEEVHKLTAHMGGIKATPIYGGASYDRQIRALQSGAQIVVGTPGRIIDFIERDLLRLDHIQTLVFDEADEMLDMGFKDEIDRVVKALPKERQTIFFSATLAGTIKRLIEAYTTNPVWVTIEHKAMTVPTIEQRYYEVHSRSKLEVLCRLLDMENPRLAILFANTKRLVDDVTDALMARGYSADRLHGDLNQMARDRVMKNFRSGNVELLVATDVAARGLDVDDVDLVVNIELPYDEEDYVHRIGRTGRAGRSGKAISLVSGKEIFLMQRIQRYAKVKVERHKVPTREEVEGKRADIYFEQIRACLEEGSYTSHESTVARLLEAGHSATEISSALMHLWIGESSRESEEIMEDKPRPEKGARERREPREARERRGGDDFEGRGAGAGKGPRRREGGESNHSPHHTRMFINVGALEGASPREISGAIYRTCELPEGSVGKIDIYSKCSFVLIQNDFVEKVMDTIGNSKLHGRTLRMDIAK
jgi:ATP-dependent RNA helicase DeaD